MAKRDERLLPADVIAECARAGVWLARGDDGLLYLWNEYLDDLEERLTDRLFGAIVRNQNALLRMVRPMDSVMALDVGPEVFHFKRGAPK